MKTLLLFALIIMSLYVTAGNYQITVWGMTDCQYTVKFRADLKSYNIQYTYYDVRNYEYLIDMYVFGDKYHIFESSVAYFPVVRVIINGVTHAMIRPQIQTILSILMLTDAMEIKTNILCDGHVILNPERKEVTLYNINGYQLLSSKDAEINLSDLTSGVYILRSENVTSKFVKQ